MAFLRKLSKPARRHIIKLRYKIYVSAFFKKSVYLSNIRWHFSCIFYIVKIYLSCVSVSVDNSHFIDFNTDTFVIK